MPGRPEDPYSRLNYRRLIAWPERIERESPFLTAELGRAPARSVLDLGCGTGEHVRHFAGGGVRAVGIDRSEEQIAKAREYERPGAPAGPAFLLGDLSELDALTDERFGLAICLGNLLPHLDDETLARVLPAVRRRLLPGGRLLIQLVNYERIFARGIRHLPLNFRDDPEGGGEIVFVRLLAPEADRRWIRFFPLTLTLAPGAEPPVALKAAKEVRLRAWPLAELETALAAAGFAVDGRHGNMTAGPYEAAESRDLVLTAAAT